MFPSPDCNPGVRKYWGGDERFDSFATHLFQIGSRSWEIGSSNMDLRLPTSEFPFDLASEFPFDLARSSIGRTPASQAGEMSSILIRVAFSIRKSEVGNRKCSNKKLPTSDLRIPNWIHAPVCCDGIGNLTFNQVSLDSRVQFPSGVLFDFG